MSDMLGEPIRGRKEIVSHFRTLVQAQIHLTAVFEENGEEFLTQVLDVRTPRAGEATALLDELIPRHGQAIAARRTTLRCSYRLNRAPHVFASAIQQTVDAPHPGVLIALPEEVTVHQKRRHYRVVPFMNTPVVITEIRIPTLDQNERTLGRRCVVFDLSLSGLSFNTDIPRAHLSPGTLLPHLAVKLPTGESFATRAIVRTIQRLRTGNYPHRVGLEFFQLYEDAAETLNRYIVDKQRADIRKIKREYD
jgi:c-di-GMP-binding flagellar brake protein YcgR